MRNAGPRAIDDALPAWGAIGRVVRSVEGPARAVSRLRLLSVVLEVALRLSDLRLCVLALFAFAYAGLRLAEAYGLWRGRHWAEWLAVANGTLSVPIEIYELSSGLCWIKAATLTANLVIVAYMTCVLWRSRRRSAHATPERPRRVLN